MKKTICNILLTICKNLNTFSLNCTFAFYPNCILEQKTNKNNLCKVYAGFVHCTVGFHIVNHYWTWSQPYNLVFVIEFLAIFLCLLIELFNKDILLFFYFNQYKILDHMNKNENISAHSFYAWQQLNLFEML